MFNEKTEGNIIMIQWNLLPKKSFFRIINNDTQKWIQKKKKERLSKQKEKQQSLNSIKKAVLLTKRKNNYKSINLSKLVIC